MTNLLLFCENKKYRDPNVSIPKSSSTNQTTIVVPRWSGGSPNKWSRINKRRQEWTHNNITIDSARDSLMVLLRAT